MSWKETLMEKNTPGWIAIFFALAFFLMAAEALWAGSIGDTFHSQLNTCFQINENILGNWTHEINATSHLQADYTNELKALNTSLTILCPVMQNQCVNGNENATQMKPIQDFLMQNCGRAPPMCANSTAANITNS